jgi:hypothetical protein
LIRLLPRLTLPKPGDDVVVAALSRPRIPALQIDRLPQGIDGRHIDVALGPALDKATRLYVGALLQEQLATLWKEPPAACSEKLVDLFTEQVREHHQTAVGLARDADAMEYIQLFQLTMVKLVFQHVDDELARVRTGLEDERFLRDQQMSGKALQLHRQAALLGRSAAQLRYRTARLALREINRLEHAGMRSLRKSVLGRSWPVAEVMLNNPLLLLNGLGSLRDFITHYPAVLHQLPRLRVLSDGLMQALGEWLPTGIEGGDQTARGRRGSNEPGSHAQSLSGLPVIDRWAQALIGAREIQDGVLSWFDGPDNVAALLGGIESDWPQAGPWAPRDMRNLQRQLNAKFGRAVARMGLRRHVQASYALAAIYPSLGVHDAEAAMFDYLAGEVDRADLVRRIEALTQSVDPTKLARLIDERFNAYRRGAAAQSKPQLARLAADVCRLRRDLKLAGPLLAALGRIRLLDDSEALRLSRENNSLQIFCKQTQLPDPRGSLVGHAIVRVDLRGTNALVAGMRRRGLDPAAYFSRFLYEPLTGLLNQFSAQKVMIEAGSLVLSVLQHSGEGIAQLAAARASALAQSLMEQIAALNAESERLGLTSLECSLAVVYADAPPTYLYDQSSRVLVSPANTRARQMSSCHAVLRSSCALAKGQRVCVATPVTGEEDTGTSDVRVRYNVNGIELDDAAFVRLHAEITMRKVRLRDPTSDGSSTLYVGQCPDSQGNLHWLVVRQGSVQLWMGRQLVESREAVATFYELVVDSALRRRVRERLEVSESNSVPPVTANDSRQ